MRKRHEAINRHRRKGSSYSREKHKLQVSRQDNEDMSTKILPPVRYTGTSQGIDYNNGNNEFLIPLDPLLDEKDNLLPRKLPWHHPHRSIRTSKVVNLMEETAFQLFCNSANTSGMFNSVTRFAHAGAEQRNYTAREDFRIPQHTDEDTIYIKRHLLKTRGITSLTRSINDVSSVSCTKYINSYKLVEICNMS